MALKFPPYPGTIVRCDFKNFESPEMTKFRPVVILSPKIKNVRRSTFIVVPLSTTAPVPPLDNHLKFPCQVRIFLWV